MSDDTIRRSAPDGAERSAVGFVSYARVDVARVSGVVGQIIELGRAVWLDAADIPPGSLWREELRRAIEAAGAVICFVSRNWVVSAECRAELDLAISLGKRLVPVVLEPVDLVSLPGELRAVQWIAAAGQDDRRIAAATVAAVDVDPDRVRDHTYWLAQALRWEAAARHRSTLARGRALRAAEGWLQRGGRDPQPTSLQIAFVAASRRGERRRGRIRLGLALVAVLVASTLAAVALWQRHTAVQQRNIASSRALAVASSEQLSRDPELSLLLARAGWQSARTAQALSALRAAVHQSPARVRVHLPSSVDSVMGTSRFVVTAGSDGRVTTWDVATGRTVAALNLGGALRTLFPDRTGTAALALLEDGRAMNIRMGTDGRFTTRETATGVVTGGLSSDGRSVVIGRADGSVDRSVDGGGFSPVFGLRADERPMAVAVSANGKVIAVGTGLRAYRQQQPRAGVVEGRLYVRTPGRVRMVRPALTPVERVRLDDAGSVLLSAAEDGSGVVERVTSGDRLLTITNAFLADLAPTGRYAVTSTLEGATVIGDVASHRWRAVSARSAPLSDLRFSADGDLVAAASLSRPSDVWAARDGRSLARFLGVDATTSIFIAGDDETVVTGHANGDANVWAVPRETRAVPLGNPNQNVTVGIGVNSIDVSADGAFVLAAADDGVMRTWTPQGTRRCLANGPVSDLGYCPLALAVGARVAPSALGLSALARFSPDGRRVAVEASDGSVWVFAATTIPRLIWHAAADGDAGMTGSLAFSPGGRLILAQRGDRAPRLFAAATGRPVATLRVPSGDGALCAWRSDHQIVTGDSHGRIVAYGDDGRRRRNLIDLHSAVLALAASPDGRHVAVAVGPDVTVLDATSGAVQKILSGHTDNVQALSYTRDSANLVSGSDDGTARLWDPSTATSLITIDAPGSQVQAVGFDAATHTLIAAGRNSAVYFGSCDICVSTTRLVQLAARRSTRPLTAGERVQFHVGSLLTSEGTS